MTENCFVVELDGTICQGYGVRVTQEKLAKLLKIPIEQAAQLLGGRPTQIKQGIDLATAEKYKAAVEKTGAGCRIRNISIASNDIHEQDIELPCIESSISGSASTSNDIHEQDIELLRDEAQRLVTLELDILGKMLEEPGVIAAAQAGQSQTFDRSSTSKDIEILTGEQTKLNRLEMVLAVVGIMKSGKSTTINAIVGTEVLPNRDRPMTALPTLITHTPGQFEPLLEFKNNLPIEKLMGELRQVIVLPKNRERLKNLLAKDPTMKDDMKKLLNMIENQGKFEQRYQGAEPICGFLKSLNDLVRLCTTLTVDFPFSDYNKIHELPVIKIEFVNLPKAHQAKGTLTLLDTPGPNESGQPHLEKMMQEQLAKASAVLAILDFTQLKSDSDLKVREALKEIVNVSEGRLYALVNKFDQHSSKSDPEATIKKFVADTLMEGLIGDESVFPVSSKRGYLANRAKHELSMHQKLPVPDPEGKDWVSDFGKEVFGLFQWESQITDVEAVKKGAQLLWERSQFDAPLKNVIHSAQACASVFAVESASAKLHKMAVNIENFLDTHINGVTKTTQELNSQIKALEQDMIRINNCENDAENNSEKMLDDFEKSNKSSFDRANKTMLDELDRSIREKYHHAVQGAGQQKTNDNNLIIFSDEKEAGKLIEVIKKDFSLKFNTTVSTVKKAMKDNLDKFQSNFSDKLVSDAKIIMDLIEERMVKDGFSISLPVPDASLLRLNFSGADMLGNLISEKTKIVTQIRYKQGFVGWVCQKLKTSQLGKENYDVEEPYFEINIGQIKHSIEENLGTTYKKIDEATAEQIRKPLRNLIRNFFVAFKKNVEQLRGDLQQVIKNKQNKKEEQEALAKRFTVIKRNIINVRTDCSGLLKQVQERLPSNMERQT